MKCTLIMSANVRLARLLNGNRARQPETHTSINVHTAESHTDNGRLAPDGLTAIGHLKHTQRSMRPHTYLHTDNGSAVGYGHRLAVLTL